MCNVIKMTLNVYIAVYKYMYTYIIKNCNTIDNNIIYKKSYQIYALQA